MSNKTVLQMTEAQQESVEALLGKTGFNRKVTSCQVMGGDGSDRTFLRIKSDDNSLLAILPDLETTHGLAEARAAWDIGRHLMGCGVPVPELYAFDPDNGIVLCEDLGSCLLHNAVAEERWPAEKLIASYEQAVEILAHMQVVGSRGFQEKWCWDSGKYDRELMLARESGYFTEACLSGLLGLSLPPGLAEEFVLLADLASTAPAVFFLHRDFQSRNIMIKEGRLRIIDFQGGRFGPLGYDLASLLHDPYVSLPDHIKSRLINRYLKELAGYITVDRSSFMESFYWLALQRNLQIIGAFSYLSRIKSKDFFRGFLVPAAQNLSKLLGEEAGSRFPVLRSLALLLPDKLAQADS